jgi:hypothetical protein
MAFLNHFTLNAFFANPLPMLLGIILHFTILPGVPL